MALATQKDVLVERRFQRSIRIDTDLSDPNALHGFICPPSFSSVLTTVSEHISESKQGAFTWTGPFGGGKSSLAIVFSALLSENPKLRKEALKLTGEAGKAVDKALKPGKAGYRALAVVGRKESAVDLLLEAMKREKNLYRESKKSETELSSRVLESLDRASKHEKHAGLIVFIDEMGKVLEAAAEGKGDLHFLQELAELASRSEGRLIVIGILHQSFGEYSGRMATRARDEWMKIQGRFVDIPLSLAAHEQLTILSSAIQSTPPKNAAVVAKKLGKVIDTNRQQKKSGIHDALLGCWPLSPVTAAILGPYSRRRFGQNQRSIFSFLNSSESFGFQAFLKNRTDESVYTPLDFWDYLRANVEPSIMASADSHRWSTSLDAVERCEAKGGTEDHIAVTKTLAIVEHFRDQSGFYPTVDVIAIALPHLTTAAVSKCLEELASWSIIAFRRHIDSYAIHAGSDFEIDSAIDEVRNQQSTLDVATLSRLSNIKPIMAMRHYHETGALRWMVVHVVPVDVVDKAIEAIVTDKKSVGHFIIVLPSADIPEKNAIKSIRDIASKSPSHLAFGVVPEGHNLNDLAVELLAVEQLQESRGELSGDAVARREVTSRIADIRSQFSFALNSAFLSMVWFQQDEKTALNGRVEISQFASTLADNLFAKSPKITNELLNREKLSSSAMRARRLLLAAMVDNRHQKRLGFEGYPAEAALFDSIFVDTGLHREDKKTGQYNFSLSTRAADSARIKPLWLEADRILGEATASNPKSMADVYEAWRAQPYGVKDGLLIVFGLAYLISPKNNMAVYLDNLYRPLIDDFVADRLHQEPSAIEFRKVEFSSAREKILKELAGVVSEYTDGPVSAKEPLQVAQALVSIVMSFPPWVLRTRLISDDAIELRSMVVAANDPNRFLFDDLSQLGKGSAQREDAKSIGSDLAKYSKKDLDGMVEFVRKGIIELSGAYSNMLGELKALLESELQFNNTKKGLADIKLRAANVIDLTGDFRLDAFASRLKNYVDNDENIESIASLAANKPARDWVDRDLDAARVEIAELSQRFRRGEAFARVKGREEHRDSIALVVGSAVSEGTLVKEISRARHISGSIGPD